MKTKETMTTKSKETKTKKTKKVKNMTSEELKTLKNQAAKDLFNTFVDGILVSDLSALTECETFVVNKFHADLENKQDAETFHKAVATYKKNMTTIKSKKEAVWKRYYDSKKVADTATEKFFADFYDKFFSMKDMEPQSEENE